ncbi:hypothetical protein [Aureibaculum luteum]|uniref:hypothetical protein n=1 Tax=Aureibaculum luteum TaxID=1548456 RepID=UPI000E51D553|nr:hypothetical protein [Aureibaculum luteum]
MKKLLVVAAVALFSFNVNAQEENVSQNASQTSQGKWLIEANTKFAAFGSLGYGGNTGFSFTDIDGDNQWNVGAEGGYFVIDDLAVKVGLGYGDSSNGDGIFSYKVGGKYYIMGKIPVGIDLNGVSGDEFSPMFIGAHAGYAWFLNENVSIEPGIRYDYGFNEDAGDGETNPLSLNIGFALHF